MSGVKRYNMDVDKFGSACTYQSEHGRWVYHADYERLEQERAEQWRLRRDAQADRDTANAVAAELRAQVEAMRAALLAVSIVIDGDIRPTVRDCVNGLPDVQDIYGYCDNVDAVIVAALQAKP